MPVGPRVLLVVGHDKLRGNLSTTLASWGCRAIVAGDGVGGLREFVRNDPDAVVLDIDLAGMNGLQLAMEIRGRSSAPIVLLVGKGAPLVSAIEGISVIHKPFEPRTLGRELANLIRKARSGGSENDDAE